MKIYHIFDSMLDVIYTLTAQPLNQQKLQIFFAYSGQPFNLEETCRFLGYRSLNQCIRENKKIFSKFLDIYAAIKFDDNNKSSTVLYYQNRDIKDQENVLENLQDRIIEDGHTKISIDETIYFETHNELQFIQGRKNLAKAVNKCQEIADDSFEWIDMENLQRVFPLLFETEYSKAILKEWFPLQRGKMEQILQNIVFEEIEYKYSNPELKLGLLFRLKSGETIRSILEKLENLEKLVKPWMEKLEQNMLKDSDSRRRYKRNIKDDYYGVNGNSYYRPQQPTTSSNIIKKKIESDIFGSSDSEDDGRVENAKYKENTRVRRKKVQVENKVSGGEESGSTSDSPELSKDEEKQFDEYPFFVKQYRLSNDIDLNKLYLESMKEEEEEAAEKLVKEQQPGSSSNAIAFDALKIEIPAKKVVESDSPSPVLGNQFLTQSQRVYKTDEEYTDDSEKEDSDDANDDDSSIALKPSLNVDEKGSQKGASSSSDSSENLPAAATNDLQNILTLSNNKSSEQTFYEMSEEDSKKPFSTIPEPNSSSESITPPESSNDETPPSPLVHPAPAKFEYLGGTLHRSTEMAKPKKEQYRKVRERANGTDLKKNKQMTDHLPNSVPKLPTTYSSTAFGRLQATSASAAARQNREANHAPADPNPHAAGTSPFNNSAKISKDPIVQRDQCRPYNYGLPGNNAFPVCRKPVEPGQSGLNPAVSSPLAHPSPPIAPSSVGCFAKPHNLPKVLNTTSTSTTNTTTTSTSTAARRLSPEINRKDQRHAQEKILRPIPHQPHYGPSTDLPLSPQRTENNGSNNAPPVAPHHPDPRNHQREMIENRAEQVYRPEIPPQAMNRHRQYSQSSVNSQGERRQAAYPSRPVTAQPGFDDYGNNEYIHRQDNRFRPLPQPPLPTDDDDEDDEREYYDQRQSRYDQPEIDYQQNWNNRSQGYARTPVPTSDEYIPPIPQQQRHLLRQSHHQPQPPQIPRHYPDDSNFYAVPHQRSRQSIRSIPSEDFQQNNYNNWTTQRQQQQRNYYPLSDNGYSNPHVHDPYQPQQPQRPNSVFPQSAYHSNNSHPSRPLSVHSQHSSEYRNPADHRRIGNGATSVVPQGWRQKQSAATENEVNSVIAQIRIVMAITDVPVNVDKIGTALAKARLPNEPKYIQGLGIDNWGDFISQFLAEEYIYYENEFGKFIVDINKWGEQ